MALSSTIHIDASGLAMLQRGLAACESVFALLDMPAEEDSGTQELVSAKGELAFDNVHFSYPGAEKTALNGISFQARAGQSIAPCPPAPSSSPQT